MSKPKLIEQIENAGGVFVATYNTTTYQEIKDAYDSGKTSYFTIQGKYMNQLKFPMVLQYYGFMIELVQLLMLQLMMFVMAQIKLILGLLIQVGVVKFQMLFIQKVRELQQIFLLRSGIIVQY